MDEDTIQILSKERCTGCAACANRCPSDCISLREDEEGFLYPVIDKSQCTQCGNCKNVCPILSPAEKSETEQDPHCYAAWSKDDKIRFQSASGGIFTHLAIALLAQGGIVAGAGYRPNHLVKHMLISNVTDLDTLRQSKYVQSEMGFIFKKIEEKLQQNVPVLFTGTPCQCAGLQSFLQKEYDNLFLCDFICRGVNSPKVFLAYLRELEELYGSSVKQVWFKNKTYSWNHWCTKIIFEDGQEYLADRETDPFILGFIKSRLSLYMRPSCYHCSFKGIRRPTDITLGDFWGIENQFPMLDTEKGISMVLMQSEKGHKLFEQCSTGIQYLSADFDPAHNICAVQSVSWSKERASFYRQLESQGFHAALQTQTNRY